MERVKPLRPRPTARRRDIRWGEADVNSNLNSSSEVPLPPRLERKLESGRRAGGEANRERLRAGRHRAEIDEARRREEDEIIRLRRENTSLKERVVELESKSEIWNQTEWQQLREEVTAIRQIVSSQSAQAMQAREFARRTMAASAPASSPQQQAIQGKEREVILGLYREVEYLKSVYPIKGLLKTKMNELQSLETKHNRLPQGHPEQKIIRSLMREKANEVRELQDLQRSADRRMDEISDQIQQVMR